MNNQVKDIAGERFGSLVAIEPTGKSDSSRSAIWLCICDCGNEHEAVSKSLRSGHTKSCGCYSFRPRKYQPEVGVTYGYLTYVSEAPRIVRPSKTVKAGNFTCICGKEVVKSFQEVCSGNITSCGCMKGKAGIADITGQKFDRLTAIKRTEEKRTGGYFWECVCDCGNTRLATVGALNSGQARSCGCLRVDMNTTHGMTKTPTYMSYRSMLERVGNPKFDEWYSDVEIHPDWDMDKGGSFENFLRDMGERPEGTSLNRINGAKIYSKDTCEWATLSMQSFDQKRSKVNTSGRTGVFQVKETGRWVAQIKKNGKVIQVYRGDSFEEACEARTKAEIEYFGFSKE
jgi:hypothetical protein